MPTFAVLFRPRNGVEGLPPAAVREHVARLEALAREARLIACGPFGDARGGGVVLASFASEEEARAWGLADPFVIGGHEDAEVRPWEWSRPENGHLGVTVPHPGGHPVFLEALGLRTTVREFTGEPVPEDRVRSLIAAAGRAPSDFNLQPWRPLVCLSPDSRELLRSCCFDQPQVAGAAVAVCVTVDPGAFTADAGRAVDEMITAGRIGEHEREARLAFILGCYRDPGALRDSCVRNGALFGHQLLLAGMSQGLAGFWLGGVDAPKLLATFDLPPDRVVVGVVGLGHAPGPRTPLPRRDPREIAAWR